MKVVMFIRGSTPYLPGETAGFEDAHAQHLVDTGVCIWAEQATEAEAAAKAAEDPPVEALVEDPPAADQPRRRKGL